VSDEERKPPGDEDAELEREVRAQRKFSLAEAIGRAAGDLMKGASPVTHKRQAELEIEQYLENHLADSEGALRIVLQRQVRESEDLLARSYERPMEALAGVTEHILASPARLRRFVRAVDAEWGRLYSERPYFELGEAPPRAGDPYTLESVRDTLSGLLEKLGGDAES
jgi:hypothetical protein